MSQHTPSLLTTIILYHLIYCSDTIMYTLAFSWFLYIQFHLTI